MSTTDGGNDAVLAAGQSAAGAVCEHPAGFTMAFTADPEGPTGAGPPHHGRRGGKTERGF